MKVSLKNHPSTIASFIYQNSMKKQSSRFTRTFVWADAMKLAWAFVKNFHPENDLFNDRLFYIFTLSLESKAGEGSEWGMTVDKVSGEIKQVRRIVPTFTRRDLDLSTYAMITAQDKGTPAKLIVSGPSSVEERPKIGTASKLLFG